MVDVQPLGASYDEANVWGKLSDNDGGEADDNNFYLIAKNGIAWRGLISLVLVGFVSQFIRSSIVLMYLLLVHKPGLVATWAPGASVAAAVVFGVVVYGSEMIPLYAFPRNTTLEGFSENGFELLTGRYGRISIGAAVKMALVIVAQFLGGIIAAGLGARTAFRKGDATDFAAETLFTTDPGAFGQVGFSAFFFAGYAFVLYGYGMTNVFNHAYTSAVMERPSQRENPRVVDRNMHRRMYNIHAIPLFKAVSAVVLSVTGFYAVYLPMTTMGAFLFLPESLTHGTKLTVYLGGLLAVVLASVMVILDRMLLSVHPHYSYGFQKAGGESVYVPMTVGSRPADVYTDMAVPLMGTVSGGARAPSTGRRRK
jgi:hypothetical protein